MKAFKQANVHKLKNAEWKGDLWPSSFSKGLSSSTNIFFYVSCDLKVTLYTAKNDLIHRDISPLSCLKGLQHFDAHM